MRPFSARRTLLTFNKKCCCHAYYFYLLGFQTTHITLYYFSKSQTPDWIFSEGNQFCFQPWKNQERKKSSIAVNMIDSPVCVVLNFFNLWLVLGVNLGLNSVFTTCWWAWMCYLIFFICTKQVIRVVKQFKFLLNALNAKFLVHGLNIVVKGCCWYNYEAQEASESAIQWSDETRIPWVAPLVTTSGRCCHYYGNQSSGQLGIHVRLRHQ